ncbi:fructosamine kinase family protein [Corynebacterium nuruki]|uniref:fructosamine kinase family protein n=1 Tax=Corynebacterium nuruki TaxID=1032851 RepID=UPI0039BF735B
MGEVTPQTYIKHNPGRPGDWEVAGLTWLAAVDGGVPVVGVLDRHDGDTVLERVTPTAPDAAHAEEFGRRLATTHRAGAPAFGAGPADWSGSGYQGPNDSLLELPLAPATDWGTFFASSVIGPLAQVAADRGRAVAGTPQLCARLTAGDFDDDLPPARLHGDLWSGNVLWSADGVVLIDPAAHGGHPLTDLAGLTLFGAPFLDHILGAYAEVAELPTRWRELLPLHRLHMLYLHAAVFGGGYVAETGRAVAEVLAL